LLFLPSGAGCELSNLLTLLWGEFGCSRLSAYLSTLFSTCDCSRTLASIRVFQWGAVQVLADCLFDNTASNCGEIVVLDWALGHPAILTSEPFFHCRAGLAECGQIVHFKIFETVQHEPVDF
jgi:hypothetical protein